MTMTAAQSLPRFDIQSSSQALKPRVYTFAPVKHAFAYYKFAKHGGVQRMLHHLKYKNCPEVGELVGMWFAHAIKAAGYANSFDLIIPIPLHQAKRRQRGYNQCDYIAKGLSTVLEVSWQPGILLKSQHTSSQTRKSRWERSENVAHSFRLSNAEAVINKRILLIDDVVTTGATLGRGARVLLDGGCHEVSVAALAMPE